MDGRSVANEPANGRRTSRARSLRGWAARVALVLAVLVIIAGFSGLDRWFYEFVSCALAPPDRPLGPSVYTDTRAFWFFCRGAFGYGLFGLVILAATAAQRPERWRAYVVATVTVLVVAAAANLAQGLVGRLRPNQAESAHAFAPLFSRVLQKEDVSFPSGEAAAAFAVAVVLTALYPRWWPIFFAGATLGGVARLVNGAHYLSDVAAGALGGAWLTYRLFNWLARRLAREPGHSPLQP